MTFFPRYPDRIRFQSVLVLLFLAVTGARAPAEIVAAPDDAGHPFGGHFWGTNGFDIYSRNPGNVGIGTEFPLAKLHVVGGDARIGNDSGQARLFLQGGDITQDTDIVFSQNGELKWFAGMLNNNNDDSFSILAFANPQTDALTITQAGDVGIGSVTPSERLHVVGNICATGTIGVCSDASFKKNVQRMSGSLSKVLQLRGVEFDWKQSEFPEHQFANQRQVGFVAQEIKEVIPSVVSRGNDGFYSVDYGRIAPVLVEAIKELHGTVQDRDELIAAQSQQIENLMLRLDRMEAMLAQLPDVETRSAD